MNDTVEIVEEEEENSEESKQDDSIFLSQGGLIFKQSQKSEPSQDQSSSQ